MTGEVRGCWDSDTMGGRHVITKVLDAKKLLAIKEYTEVIQIDSEEYFLKKRGSGSFVYIAIQIYSPIRMK